MEKVLVTGSNGLVGQAVVSAYLQQGKAEVFGLSHHANRNAQLPNSHYFSTDIADLPKITILLKQLVPTIIIHCAAKSQVQACEQDNFLADQTNTHSLVPLLDYAVTNSAYLVFLSTDFVFDGKKGLYKETDEPNPVNYYGSTKLAAEKLILESSATAAIARTVLVYGYAASASRPNFFTWVVDCLKQGKPLQIVNDQWRTPTYVKDLAKGCLQLADRKAEGVYHLSGSEWLTPYDFAKKIAGVLGYDAELITATNASLFKENGRRPLKTGFNISKAIGRLGYAPSSLEKGILAAAKDYGNPL